MNWMVRLIKNGTWQRLLSWPYSIQRRNNQKIAQAACDVLVMSFSSEETSPLIDWYKNEKKYQHINGLGTMDGIFADICEAVDKL